MLVELRLVEQRYQAVLEVLNDGATVTDVARRHGVARQTVHGWLRRYAAGGLAGLADESSKPLSCPHQMAPSVEARIVELRRQHPGWGPRTILRISSPASSVRRDRTEVADSIGVHTHLHRGAQPPSAASMLLIFWMRRVGMSGIGWNPKCS